MTSPFINGKRSRSLTILNILFLYLGIDVLANELSSTELSNIIYQTSIEISFNDNKRRTSRRLSSSILFHQRIDRYRSISRDLRADNYSGSYIRLSTRINRNDDILRDDCIKECTHFSSINRIFKEIDMSITNRCSIMIGIINVARICKTKIQSYTIISLKLIFYAIRDSYVDEYAHTVFSIDISNISRDLLISIRRNHSDIVDIFQSTLSSMSFDLSRNFIYNFRKLTQNNCRRDILELLIIFEDIENFIRKKYSRSSTITNSRYNMTSNRFYVILNGLLDDTIIGNAAKDIMTILSVAV